jgi:hypothetical protein
MCKDLGSPTALEGRKARKKEGREGRRERRRKEGREGRKKEREEWREGERENRRVRPSAPVFPAGLFVYKCPKQNEAKTTNRGMISTQQNIIWPQKRNGILIYNI